MITPEVLVGVFAVVVAPLGYGLWRLFSWASA